MTISLERARECIGRKVISASSDEVKGHVERVGEYDVWVRVSENEVLPCDPETLEWVKGFSDDMRRAIKYNADEFDGGQVRHGADVRDDDEDDDGYYCGLSVVYTPGMANDDGEKPPLYVISRGQQQVHITWPTASPDGAREIEELLGWAKP